MRSTQNKQTDDLSLSDIDFYMPAPKQTKSFLFDGYKNTTSSSKYSNGSSSGFSFTLKFTRHSEKQNGRKFCFYFYKLLIELMHIIVNNQSWFALRIRIPIRVHPGSRFLYSPEIFPCLISKSIQTLSRIRILIQSKSRIQAPASITGKLNT